jgi:hypothetical protein
MNQTTPHEELPKNDPPVNNVRPNKTIFNLTILEILSMIGFIITITFGFFMFMESYAKKSDMDKFYLEFKEKLDKKEEYINHDISRLEKKLDDLEKTINTPQIKK